MCVYFRSKFEVSSIILTSFRQGDGNFTPSPLNFKTNPLKTKPRLRLTMLVNNRLNSFVVNLNIILNYVFFIKYRWISNISLVLLVLYSTEKLFHFHLILLFFSCHFVQNLLKLYLDAMDVVLFLNLLL